MTINIKLLIIFHVLIIAFSNLLVQYPFTILGFHTTCGAFTYPLIFITTDLTTRLLGQNTARKVIFNAMFPCLFISYLVTAAFSTDGLWHFNIMALRIAFACFTAYSIGQLLDITVFQRFRNSSNWWLAPLISLLIGNLIDTLVFFSSAFYHCNNEFLSTNWPEIALVDMFFKLTISIFCFLPVYGAVLNYLLKYFYTQKSSKSYGY